MTAREIIRKEYGDSANFITPRRLGCGAYELSAGTGFDNTPIFGVSVVRLNDDGTTKHETALSQSFRSRDAAQAYIRNLRRGIMVKVA